MGYQPPNDIDPAARELIRHKVRRIIGAYKSPATDRADLEQELALKAHVASVHYDPARASARTFYNCVLTRRCSNLLSASRAAKRNHRRYRPCESSLVYDRARHLELRYDLYRALSPLPLELRIFAAHLTKTSLAETARLMGLTRQQARERRLTLANHLSEAGFGPQREKIFSSTTIPRVSSVNNCQRCAPMTGHKVEAVTAGERSADAA
jgi:hypothetical protein